LSAPLPNRNAISAGVMPSNKEPMVGSTAAQATMSHLRSSIRRPAANATARAGRETEQTAAGSADQWWLCHAGQATAVAMHPPT